MTIYNLVKLAKSKKDDEPQSGLSRVRSELARNVLGNIGTAGLQLGAGTAATNMIQRTRTAAEEAEYDKVLDYLKTKSEKHTSLTKPSKLFGLFPEPETDSFVIKNKQGGEKKITIGRARGMSSGSDGHLLDLKDAADVEKKYRGKGPAFDDQLDKLKGLVRQHGLDPATEYAEASKPGAQRHHQVGLKQKDASILLHELGHSAGKGREDTLKNKLINLNRKGYGYGVTPKAMVAAGLAPSLVNAVARKRSDESDEEYMDRKQKYRNRISAAATATALPTLVEEARASINAVNLGKKMGVKVNKKDLLAAYSTYLATGVAPSLARNMADRFVTNREKAALKNRKNNN